MAGVWIVIKTSENLYRPYWNSVIRKYFEWCWLVSQKYVEEDLLQKNLLKLWYKTFCFSFKTQFQIYAVIYIKAYENFCSSNKSILQCYNAKNGTVWRIFYLGFHPMRIFFFCRLCRRHFQESYVTHPQWVERR